MAHVGAALRRPPKGKICWRAGRLLDGLVLGEEINQALGRVGAETHLEDPFCLHSLECAAEKKVLLIRDERGFNVAGLAAMAFPSSAPSNVARLTPSPGDAIRCAASPSSGTPRTRSHLCSLGSAWIGRGTIEGKFVWTRFRERTNPEQAVRRKRTFSEA